MANVDYLPPIATLLQGDPFGDVFPPERPIDSLPKDGRTACLEVLVLHLSGLRFILPPGVQGNPKQEPLPFHIPASAIEIEEPRPDPSKSPVVPRIGIISIGDEMQEPLGLTSYIDEDTCNVFAPGTALQRQGEHVETFGLEVWASSRPERRAIIAGIESGLSPTEQMSGIRFKIPAYYWSVARFTLQSTTRDDTLVGEGFWRAVIKVELNFTILALVRYRVASFGADVDTIEAAEAQALLSTE